MRLLHLQLLLAVLVLAFLTAACGGIAGPPGPIGPAGPAGPIGPQGPPGQSAGAPAYSQANSPLAEYVGDDVCRGCHPDIYKSTSFSGHPWSLTKSVEGVLPDYPYTRLDAPPQGYDWADIRYIIGGYYWKAIFVDKAGYIITDAPGRKGDTAYLNQFNFSNDSLGKSAGWVSFNPGQEKVLFTCGECHTTGFAATSNQDGLPGLIGSWEQDGVRCERCHAPGSQHVTSPQTIEMPIDRTADLCLDCHAKADLRTVDETDVFGDHHDPANVIYRGKHMVLDCVDCHDPHSGVVQARQTGTTATPTACAECHFQEAKYQRNAQHVKLGLECAECHLPRTVSAAWGDAEKFSGDIHSHQVAIDPTRFDQLSIPGDPDSYVLAPNGLNYTCRRCHGGGSAPAIADEGLQAAATGYHNP